MAKESLSHTARVALYARVSTLNHNQDPEMQLRELRQYATARGWDASQGQTLRAGAWHSVSCH
jgi:DNA invertase Pin-like site-specific DNA recombinase